ncbi:hypothetical protein QBC34DRAFT_413614 [Podospora aff. communis PSN243]|uniref:DUF1445 domain protein n=1 Tax=Podospora aff. communis PSN243 TaxID=3040156 RepID=A0AAV9GDC6_9PEZI|nr:hypothetical protein QBC34DRAFT_413614 [Podospora aff. communis PSN243]
MPNLLPSPNKLITTITKMTKTNPSAPYQTGVSTRLAARSQTLTTQTSGLAPSHLQANLLVLPARYAPSFRLLCRRNPVPCPLIAQSSHPGSFSQLTSYLRPTSPSNPAPIKLAWDIDLRRDAPKYIVYRDGEPVEEVHDLESHWGPDHVGFLIGCSYSFEEALSNAGLPPRHTVQGRNVAMYRTTVPLLPAGVFTGGTYVVSMRPYRVEDVERVREITRRYVATHGEPIAWGWEGMRRLGIEDIGKPDWGDVPLMGDGEGVFGEGKEDGVVPVFWGCGVTPQEAVMKAGLEGVVMGHAPGHMIVLDVKDHEVFGGAVKSR